MNKKFFKEISHALAMLSQLGILMFTTIAISFFIGLLLDRKFSTSPCFLIIFIILGVAAAFRNMFIAINKNNNDKK